MTEEFNYQSAGQASPHDIIIYDATGKEISRFYGAEIIDTKYKWAELEWHPEGDAISRSDITFEFIGKDEISELPSISYDDYLKIRNEFLGTASIVNAICDNMIETFEQLSKVMLDIAEAWIKPLLNFWDQFPHDVKWELERKERNRARYYRRYNRHKGKSK